MTFGCNAMLGRTLPPMMLCMNLRARLCELRRVVEELFFHDLLPDPALMGELFELESFAFDVFDFEEPSNDNEVSFDEKGANALGLQILYACQSILFVLD